MSTTSTPRALRIAAARFAISHTISISGSLAQSDVLRPVSGSISYGVSACPGSRHTRPAEVDGDGAGAGSGSGAGAGEAVSAADASADVAGASAAPPASSEATTEGCSVAAALLLSAPAPSFGVVQRQEAPSAANTSITASRHAGTILLLPPSPVVAFLKLNTVLLLLPPGKSTLRAGGLTSKESGNKRTSLRSETLPRLAFASSLGPLDFVIYMFITYRCGNHILARWRRT